ncbi:bcl-2 homologous antagonist/killer-like [Haliotis rubra]|uniref:bcl-2 homologous antagonist/killer-like n=1 Tax=Haliotis rubra TaxID=36100 RepID=UPI001EE50A60|nr:bcl-2 homologous antagonist/killer-like [Haliotis rubra]XP_046569500.1 bcl-2 homologous antagonist/killer-like [Haliotis rubra]
MASWNGGDRNSDDDFSHPPREPRYAIPEVPRPENLRPDTEDNVQRQTEDVFRNFMYQSYRQTQIRQQYDSTPRIQEFVSMNQDPVSSTAQIGRQLARIGDEINDRFSDEFDGMIRSLKLDKNSIFDVFTNVAKKTIAGGLSWGRVIALLSFGFRMVMKVLQDSTTQVPDFLRMIISTVARVFLVEKISQWIADQGGWIASLTFQPTASNLALAFVGLAAVSSICAVIYYKTFA